MISRRHLILAGVGAAGIGVLGACSRNPETVSPFGAEVAAAEAARKPGTVREFRLTATANEVDLGGLVVPTWAYGNTIPAKPIRVTAGEQIKAIFDNQLPVATSIHWHGVALRNDADGVPGVTQDPIASGALYTYQFTAAQPGTYWFHPHTGVQLDRGLYAPLIVDDPREALIYDSEWIVVLDDWLDGVTGTPEAKLAELKSMAGMMSGGHNMNGMGGMSGMAGMMGMTSVLLGGDAGDVAYPHYLINGRLAADPDTFAGKPGQRLRIRFINAGSDTAFRVALGGHTMRVTHTDGFPVRPTDTDALLIGMGERYDVLITLTDGVFPLVAVAEGKGGAALALVRTGGGSPPPAGVRPSELDRRILSYRQLQAEHSVALAARQPARTLTLKLTGSMMNYDWRFDNKTFDHAKVQHVVSLGERVRIDFINTTMMWHPVHLHGHTFAMGDAAGARKDTAMVLPGQTVSALFDADNPGRWMIHCHNAYHAEAGMMTMLGYRT